MSAATVHAGVTARGVQLDVEAAPGRVLGVIGPNGAGKSTLVHLLAGRLRPDTGTVTLGGRVVAGPGVWVPPWQRHVGLLAQRPVLFGHLDVLENVAFGPRARGVSRRRARQRAALELDAVGCGSLAARRPHQVSGGEAQRVALARALASDPDLVVLDEPLAALDVTAAGRLRALLRERLRGRTVVLVTHGELDLWSLADDVAVLDHGRVRAHGPVDDVLRRPPTDFAADFAGLNRLCGTCISADVVRFGDFEVVGVPDPDAAPAAGDAALALFAPAAVALYPAGGAPQGSPRNTWRGTVIGLEARGGVVRVRLTVGAATVVADVTARSVGTLGLAAGVPVEASVKAVGVRLTRGRRWAPSA